MAQEAASEQEAIPQESKKVPRKHDQKIFFKDLDKHPNGDKFQQSFERVSLINLQRQSNRRSKSTKSSVLIPKSRLTRYPFRCLFHYF